MRCHTHAQPQVAGFASASSSGDGQVPAQERAGPYVRVDADSSDDELPGAHDTPPAHLLRNDAACCARGGLRQPRAVCLPCVRLTPRAVTGGTPPAVDDGRTPGKKAGWSDGLTDEERHLRDFYDPKADDDDERWVVEHLKHTAISRASGSGSGRKQGSFGAAAQGGGADAGADTAAGDQKRREGRRVGGVQLPPSDAVLSCPACFGLICLDCQRHEAFGNQWRAMFAQNVRVLTEERLTVGSDVSAGEWYHKVLCDYCEVDVGVRDQDEVYHFFDVFPS